MKKKILFTLLSVICAFACLLGMAACNNKPSFQKTEEYLRVSDGVFEAAGYVKSTSDHSKRKSVSAKNDSTVMGIKLLSANARSENEITANLRELYETVATDGNTNGLDEYNLNYLKGDALYQGVNLAGVFRAMASILGDNAFDTVYDVTKITGTPDSVGKLESGDFYTLRVNGGGVSFLRIDFAEYTQGKFVFKLAQYSKMNDRSELRFSYFDSESAAFIAELHGEIGFDFADYDENYNSFEVAECTIVVFGDENYVSDHTPNDKTDEKVLKFVKENLGFDNRTYQDLSGMNGGKDIGNKDVLQIGAEISKNRYINPYLGTHSNVTPKNEYTIPSDVRVVAPLSIPATKKLIVPAHVEKILDAPFLYPQCVEEIVFEDPDNGALVQIGNDDVVEDGFEPFNNSRYFFLSFTKVKNFTLPKTVKKIEGVFYVTTEMETFDLSAYHPDYEMSEFNQSYYGYRVRLSTSAWNQSNQFKEHGSIDKVYINGDFSIAYEEIHTDYLPFDRDEDGNMNIDVFDVDESIKFEPEFNYRKNDNESAAYSPSQDIFDMLFALKNSGKFTNADEIYSYLNWHKIEHLVNEVIATGVNEHIDLQSDLFASVSLTVDVEDFGALYHFMKDAQADNISCKMMQNGQEKTSINLYDFDGSDLSSGEKSRVKTPEGEKFISALQRGEIFYAPSATATKTSGDETLYFVGWSFSKDAATVDFYEGDEVVNYFQNMVPVYLPATENGVTYAEEGDEATATVNGFSDRDGIIVIRNEYNGKSVRYVSLENYSCKKIIIPDTVNGANSGIFNALAEGSINDLKNIWKISDAENIRNSLGNHSSLREKLKTCGALYYETGLYYLRNNVSYHWMLFAVDQDLAGRVFIPNDCYILAAEFGSNVTEIVLPSDMKFSKLQYVAYLKFDSLNDFTIYGSVKQIDYVSGKVNRSFRLALSQKSPVMISSYAFMDLQVSEAFIDAAALTNNTVLSLVQPNEIFKNTTNLYLSCEYKDIQNYDFRNIGENVYFYSESEPNYNDDDVGSYQYWHYDNRMNFVVWERPEENQ